MIVNAILSIIEALVNAIMSILPGLPTLPPEIVSAMNWINSYIIQGAGIIRYLLGDVIYLATIDFFIGLYTYKLFLVIFNFVKKYVLMR